MPADDPRANAPTVGDGRMTRQRQRAEERRQLKAAKRVSRPGHWRPDDDVAVVAGWCLTEDDLPDARKESHDIVIKLLGEKRRGGVSWKWADGDAAYELVRVLSEGEHSLEHLDHYRRLRAHLREWGGFIVLAMAKGERGAL